MADIFQTTFSNGFSSMKIVLFWFKFHWHIKGILPKGPYLPCISIAGRALLAGYPRYVPKGPINNYPALAQIMAWRWPGNKPLSELMMVELLTHICVSRPWWVTKMVSDVNTFTGVEGIKKLTVINPLHSKLFWGVVLFDIGSHGIDLVVMDHSSFGSRSVKIKLGT